jgi:hypothetical protein
MTINDSVRNQLQSALQVRTSGEAARWLLDARKEAETGSRERLLAIYTEASMRLGRLPLAAPTGESSTAARKVSRSIAGPSKTPPGQSFFSLA